MGQETYQWLLLEHVQAAAKVRVGLEVRDEVVFLHDRPTAYKQSSSAAA